MRAWLGGLITALALALCPLAAQAGCKVVPEGTGKPIPLAGPLDEPTRLGLSEAIKDALWSPDGPDWPRDAIAKAHGCSLGKFQAGGKTYDLLGGLGEVPPRWAAIKGDPARVFLALGPNIETGYSLVQTPPQGAQFTIHDPMYLLVLATPTMLHVLRLYDAAPSDAVLKADMTLALERRLDLVADYHPASKAVSLQIPVASGRQARLALPLPHGAATAARITSPDGDLFVADGGGGAKMAGSGFDCARAFGAYGLGDMQIITADEQTRDTDCRFMGEDGWITVFVTRRPNLAGAKAAFDDYIKDAQGVVPPVAAATLPFGTGMRPLADYGVAWRDKDGQEQSLWVSQIGDWYVEVRATYDPKTHDRIGAAAAAIFQAVYRDVHAPLV